METPTTPFGWGWIRDQVDFRDIRFTSEVVPENLPASIDLRPTMPPVYDQLSIGSCTANAAAAALWSKERIRTGKLDLADPSRLFIYYNTRLGMSLVKKGDTGASIRDTIKAVKKYSAPDESDWPYVVEKFNKRAPKHLYEAAKEEVHAITYKAVDQNLVALKQALVDGHPINFGFMVYQSFMSEHTARTGQVIMPHYTEQPLGGHATLICGYDDNRGCFIVRNSWGTSWARESPVGAGYFLMPYAYVLHPRLSADFWVIQTA